MCMCICMCICERIGTCACVCGLLRGDPNSLEFSRVFLYFCGSKPRDLDRPGPEGSEAPKGFPLSM